MRGTMRASGPCTSFQCFENSPKSTVSRFLISPLRIIIVLLQYLCWCCSSVDDVPFTQYSGVIAFAGCANPLVRFQLVSWVCAFEPTFPTALATNSEQHQEAGFLHLVSFRKLELVEQDGV